MMSGERPDPHEAVERLLSVARVVERRLERGVEEASGLSLVQLDFLQQLDRAGGALPLGKVADGLCCVRSNVTQLADRLESHGCIRREDDPCDRRSVRAVLTEEGRSRLGRGWAARRRLEEEVADEAGSADLSRVLERIRRKVE